VDQDDRLRLDYEQTTGLLRDLAEIRFRLLALVPTIAGLAVGFFGHPRPGSELAAIGLLGFVATLGIFVYELRNSQVQGALLQRAAALERLIDPAGGVYAERPATTLRLAGVIPVSQRLGLALVYGAAFAGWSYLAAWGILQGANVVHPQDIGAAIGAAVGLLVLAETQRAGRA
jgi:hypothetical protein